ncbi:MAG TPA: hypothetical protein VFI65_31315 [Streptosporangiaceae bacterium]|nr:hypothetical protein [Streptosporangiaceae bacterium]
MSLEAPYHSASDMLGVPAVSAFVVLMAVQTVAFTLSPGPLIALRLIRPRALALAAPWLLGAAYLTRVIPTHYPVPVWVAEIGVAAFALAGVPALITAGGRRLLMLIVVIPLSAEVVTVLTFANVNFWAFSQTGQLVSLYLPPVVLASMTAWTAGRAQRRSRRVPSLS